MMMASTTTTTTAPANSNSNSNNEELISKEEVVENLKTIRREMEETLKGKEEKEGMEQGGGGGGGRRRREPRLVAVGKTKPGSLIAACYHEAGHRSFGENYVQELVGKAEELRTECPEIEWHFIGHLQDNKAKKLIWGVGSSLKTVETVDSIKLAKTLEKTILSAIAKGILPSDHTLRVFLQVNTSGETTKSGAKPGEELLALARFVQQETPHLRLSGLMTIGQYDPSCPTTKDFECLSRCRTDVAKELGRAAVAAAADEESLELSMGMSHDFQEALRAGSTSIRVGSSIFGKRFYPPQQQPVVIGGGGGGGDGV
jgi:pyridoxal phosphate enzyme (YggS family)